MASGASVAAASFVRFPAGAAEFEYKYAHALPLVNPGHVYLVKIFDDIRAKTNGRLNVQVFGNNALGGDAAIISQVQLGSIQFINASGGMLSSMDIPVAQIDSVGFAFRTEDEYLKTMDGPLGAFIRKQVAVKNLYVYPNILSLGPRAITVNPHPIASPDDFRGLKLRASPAKIAYDLFSSLGATPTPVDSSSVYTALQTHLIDGNDQALSVFYDLKLYEVQKYLSLTYHISADPWVTASTCSASRRRCCLSDIQTLVARLTRSPTGSKPSGKSRSPMGTRRSPSSKTRA